MEAVLNSAGVRFQNLNSAVLKQYSNTANTDTSRYLRFSIRLINEHKLIYHLKFEFKQQIL